MPDTPRSTGTRRVWRRLPAFVASAFRDMDRERDHVNTWVMPQVNQRLADLGLGCEVYPVDLRWGLTTDEGFGADERLRSILETCLDEVDRCHPLFIGFLAEGLGTPIDPALAGPVLDRHGLNAPPGRGVDDVARDPARRHLGGIPRLRCRTAHSAAP